MATPSCDELDLGTDLSMVCTGCTKLLWRKFKNKSEGGQQGPRGAFLGSSYSGWRRKIGRGMPPDGIQCAGSVWPIKTIKCGSNSLNK
jgi:hypothetical protein